MRTTTLPPEHIARLKQQIEVKRQIELAEKRIKELDAMREEYGFPPTEEKPRRTYYPSWCYPPFYYNNPSRIGIYTLNPYGFGPRLYNPRIRIIP